MLKKEEKDNYKENIRLFAAKTRFVKHGTLAFLGGGCISVVGQLIYDGLRHVFFAKSTNGHELYDCHFTYIFGVWHRFRNLQKKERSCLERD